MAKVVVFGCSGHAKVVIDALEREGKHEVLGLLGKDRDSGTDLFGYPVLGTDEHLRELVERQGIHCGIIAIGNNGIRQQVSEKIASFCPGFEFITTVHPTSEIGREAEIGPGAFIAAGATVCADATVGPHSVVNTNASVDHDCILEPFTFIGPNAALGGSVRVGEKALVGLGASVIPCVTIGANATIGAGAVVIHDIPAGALAVGVPAQIRRS